MERQVLLVFVDRNNVQKVIDLPIGQFLLYGSVSSGVNSEK
jgi:hypothetical protein